MEIQENYVQLQINNDDACYLKALEVLAMATKGIDRPNKNFWVFEEINDAVRFYKSKVMSRDK